MKTKVLAVVICLVIFLGVPATAAESKDLILDEVLNIMSKEYYSSFDPIVCREEIRNALFSGFRVEKKTGCMDPYFDYISEKDWDEYMEKKEGSYTGIGVFLAASQEGIKVFEVVKDGPADKAGIKKGDILISAREEGASDEVLIKEKNDIEILKGIVGTKVFVSVRRDGKILIFPIIREEIELKDVLFEKLDNGVLYIAIKEFSLNRTPKDFRFAMEQADAENPRVIIDLRENPGGMVSLAMEMLYNISDNPDDIITTWRYSNGDEKINTVSGQGEWYYWVKSTFMPPPADAPGRFSRYKIIILVNKKSASTAEIFAGALKDWGFPIVGETTYGKGIAQRYFPLTNKHLLKITIFEYFVGNSKSKVHGLGIAPDYPVEDSRKIPEDTSTPKDRQFMKAVEVLQNME